MWEWFILPIYGDLGGGLRHCFTHILGDWTRNVVNPYESTISDITSFMDGNIPKGTMWGPQNS